MEKVKVYTRKDCAYCPMVKKLLNMKEIPFEEIDADTSEDYAQYGYRTVPLTVYKEHVVAGWNPGRLFEVVRSWQNTATQ